MDLFDLELFAADRIVVGFNAVVDVLANRFAALLFAFRLVPKTKGLSLESIEKLWT